MIFHVFHSRCHGRAQAAVLGPLQQHVKACRLGQDQGASALEIILHEWPAGHSSGSLVGFDCLQRRVIAVRRMAQEDQAQDGHEVLIRCEVRIGPQAIRDLPEVRLELFDAGKVIRNHSSVVFPMFFSIEAVPVACCALSRSYLSTANTTTVGYPCWAITTASAWTRWVGRRKSRVASLPFGACMLPCASQASYGQNDPIRNRRPTSSAGDGSPRPHWHRPPTLATDTKEAIERPHRGVSLEMVMARLRAHDAVAEQVADYW